MPTYLAPGVYIEEINSGPPPIQGVGTNIPAFIGAAQRGPIEGPPTAVTSYADFVRTFGGPFEIEGFGYSQDLPPAVKGFFDNGGQVAYIARVMRDSASPPAAATATITLTGGITTRLTADVPAGATVIYLRDLRGITVGTELALSTLSGATLTVGSADPATGAVTLSAALTNTSTLPARSTIVSTNLADPATQIDGTGLPHPIAGGPSATGGPTSLELAASNPGTWGKSIQIVPSIQSAARSTAVAVLSPTQLQLKSGAGFYVGAWIEIDNGAQKKYVTVSAVDGPVLTVAGAPLAATDLAAAGTTFVSSCEFGLTISYQDPVELTTVQETYNGLTINSVPGRYYADQLVASALVTVTSGPPAARAAGNPFLFPGAPDGLNAVSLWTGGQDLAPADFDVLGYDNGPGKRSGLLAIADLDDVAMLAAPGVTSQTVQQALIDQCELLKDRFAVLDPVSEGEAPATLNDIEDQRNLYDSEYAALYYPRLVIPDPISGPPNTRTIAPSGHIIGVYARVDNTRGVYKAPANEFVLGINGFEAASPRACRRSSTRSTSTSLRDSHARCSAACGSSGARCVTSDSRLELRQRPAAVHLHREVTRHRHAVGGVRAQRREAVGPDPGQRHVFLTGVWQGRRADGHKPEEAFFVTAIAPR